MPKEPVAPAKSDENRPDPNVCIICMDETKPIPIEKFPCGHGSVGSYPMCGECRNRIATCPVCRASLRAPVAPPPPTGDGVAVAAVAPDGIAIDGVVPVAAPAPLPHAHFAMPIRHYTRKQQIYISTFLFLVTECLIYLTHVYHNTEFATLLGQWLSVGLGDYLLFITFG